MIVAIGAIAMQLLEVCEQALDIIERMRTLRMARQLDALQLGLVGLLVGSDIQSVFRIADQFARTSNASDPQRRAIFFAELLVWTNPARQVEDHREIARLFKTQRTSVVPGFSSKRRRSGDCALGITGFHSQEPYRDHSRQIHARILERNDILNRDFRRSIFLGQHQSADQHSFIFGPEKSFRRSN